MVAEDGLSFQLPADRIDWVIGSAFGAIAVGLSVVELIRRRGLWRGVAIAYLALVLAWFGFFYPVMTGMPLSPHQLPGYCQLAR